MAGSRTDSLSLSCRRQSGRREAPGLARRCRLTLVSSRPPWIRACDSPAHGSPTFFTCRHSAFPVRQSVGSRREDGFPLRSIGLSRFRGLVSDDPPAGAGLLLTAVSDEPRQTCQRVERALVEELDGAPVAEVTAPAGEEPVEVLDDAFDGKQPLARGDLPDTLAGMLHGLA